MKPRTRNFQLVVLITVVILLVASSQFTTNAQSSDEATPTRNIATTNIIFPSDLFPSNIHCSDIESISAGPEWGAITIGVSTTEDLQSYIDTLSPNYKVGHPTSDSVLFALPILKEGEIKRIPVGFIACIKNNVITVLRVGLPFPTPFTYEGALYVDDMVARYGIPDAIGWYATPSSRLLFWFEEGIAATVSIESNELVDNDILVIELIFFPYQNNVGYQERWPYKYVALTPLPDYPGDEEKLNVENPFDFEAMVLTITAEPSNTPTQTLVPEPTKTPM